MRLSMDPKMLRSFVPLVLRSMLKPNVGDPLRPLAFRPAVHNYSFTKQRLFSVSAAVKSDTKSQAASNDSSSEVDQEGKRGGDEKLREELDKAVSDNAALLTQSREFEDKYKRALAETENLRTRLTKQISDSKLYAIQGFCKDITEISDILRLAIDSVPKDQVTKDNPHLKNLFDGLTMTESRLLQVFKSHGLAQINPVDEKFNPNEHEAVVQQAVEGKESGTVIFVTKLGYKLHDRVIRPAVVGVAK
ncbi:GrpE protein, mitochondrial [Orchesella cincta]|uniref:GrpE protein homolog n=1 Tax=Orchesella cincta TaxID=48709 RepID=A0A1D2MJI6_ORCCI|nr:GrpE protein, mitochondrial [Orchesella cincta]